MAKLVQVEEREIVKGKEVFNLSVTAASDDWIRAGRLQKENKKEEFQKLDNVPMLTPVED